MQSGRVVAPLLAIAVTVTACHGGGGTGSTTSSGANIKIFVGVGRDQIAATNVVVIGENNQTIATGHVTSVGDSNGRESVIEVAMDGQPALYPPALADVCHNVIRVKNGSSNGGAPTTSLVIPIVQSTWLMGDC